MKQDLFKKEILIYLDNIYNAAYRLSGNSDTADDLTQEVFLKAYKAFDSFEKGSKAKAWLFTILKNSFFDLIKKEKRYVSFDEFSNFASSDISILSENKGYENPEKQVSEDELKHTLKREIDKIPIDFREALILCDIECFTYEEIAKILKCPIGTVRSRISRARSFLKLGLKKYL